tara:strand:- start:24 stop:335 length:312 start_codon:yes stop_codon:yes gene_type:complete
MTKTYADGEIRDMTTQEQAEYDARQVEANSVPVRLETVRMIRDRLLKQSDWRASSDYTMSDEWKAKRQSWRDAPQNFNTKEKLDELLASDDNGNLIHSVWSKP